MPTKTPNQTSPEASGILIVVFDFKGMLAHLSGDTRAKSWREINGPESGCGLDYWYHHRNYGDVYINMDQGEIKISHCNTDECWFEGDPTEDPELKKFVRTQ